jgi:hypothetical protein
MVQARTSPLATRIALLAVTALALSSPDALAKDKTSPSTFNVIPVTFTNVTVQGGQLLANGNIGSTPFALPLNLVTRGFASAAATCPILDLQLGPINLTLLGLNVDTSPVCLEITATQGGGLLGDLLCAIANLLDGQTALADILAGVTPTQLNTLNWGLTTVLNQTFVPITSSNAFVGATCEVLHLAVGPLDLTLLGLNVSLDDCSGGPVVVDITATPGGGLLGDLLCSLSDVMEVRRPNPNRIVTALRAITFRLGQLIGQVEYQPTDQVAPFVPGPPDGRPARFPSGASIV